MMEDLFFSKNIFIICKTSSVNMNNMEKKTCIDTDGQSIAPYELIYIYIYIYKKKKKKKKKKHKKKKKKKTIYKKINSSPYSMRNNSNFLSTRKKCLQIFVR